MPYLSIRQLAARIPEGQRLHFLHIVLAARLDEIHEAVTQRLTWLQQVKRCTELVNQVPSVRLLRWERDCDLSEGWHQCVIAVKDLQARIERDLAGAEGPMSHRLAAPSYSPKLPASRDRALEAFEDGHTWSIHD